MTFLKKKRKFKRIARDIKSIKIQGARNVARQGIYAYSLFPTAKSKRKILSLRPTEPMLEKVLDMADKKSYKEIVKHFDEAQNKINLFLVKLIGKNNILFTHCHSTNVINALIYAKKKGKKFEVYNTETRPQDQGRKTAKHLTRNKIKVTMFVDSALDIALSDDKGKKRVDKIFIGADALLKEGVINKIGSKVIAKIAKSYKIPFYVVADSWKFTNKKVPIEQRELNEVWDNAPKKIKIMNPAFEFVPKKYIKAIISEYGILSYDKFLKKVR